MNKDIAMTAVIDGDKYAIGLTSKAHRGYSPTSFGTFDSYEAAQSEADALNAEILGLSKLEATSIVLASMNNAS
jgi:hypothetical protein